jgi:hypothetical protein
MTPSSERDSGPSDCGSSPRATAVHDADCSRLLAAADAALVVVLGSSPRSWLAARDSPRDVAFVATYPHPDCHRTFSDPGDTVGIALAVEEWHRTLPDDAVPAVCLAGVDTLVEYAGGPEARRFLQVVTGRMRAAGGTIHCHGDVAAGAMVAPDHYLLGDPRRTGASAP